VAPEEHPDCSKQGSTTIAPEELTVCRKGDVMGIFSPLRTTVYSGTKYFMERGRGSGKGKRFGIWGFVGFEGFITS